jgi:hypothetical protein
MVHQHMNTVTQGMKTALHVNAFSELSTATAAGDQGMSRAASIPAGQQTAKLAAQQPQLRLFPP